MNTTTTTTTTMSTTTTPPDWFQHFYQPTDSTTTTTTLPPTNYPDLSFLGSSINSPTSPTPITSTTTTTNTTPTGLSLLIPVQEGRVSKPARRRTRASRKNPTTLLNTDTTNFRAMVQRYTGGTFDSPAGFINIGGQNCNFNQQQGSSSGLLGLPNYPQSSSASPGGVDLRAQQLHQQLLQQYGAAAFSATANANVGSRAVDHRAIGSGMDQEEGVSSVSHAGSRVGPGSGQYGDNKRGGGFTY